MNVLSWLTGKQAPVGTKSAFLLNEAYSSLVPDNVKAFAKEGYCENPVVFACASIIATAAASVKLEIHSYNGDDKKVEVSNPLLDLLAKPNPMQTWEDFAIEMFSWHRVAGEFFVLRLPATGKPRELYLLNPDMMDVKKGKGNIPLRYEYGDGAEKQVFAVNQLTGISQILHVKTFNPINSWRGLSPLAPAARAVDRHNNGSRWNASLMLNAARPSGIIEVAGTVAETTLAQMREYFKKAWQGVANAGNVPMLTGGAKFTALSHTPKDMDFEKSMDGAAKDTGLVYGVPLPLLTMEAATFSNMDAAQERLWTDTVLPLLNVVVKKLGDFLLPLFDANGKQLAYNADSVPALEPKRERMFKRMGSAVSGGLLTPNEARAEMGYDAMEGGDTLFMPGTLKPITAANDNTGNSADDLAKSMKAAGYTAGEIAEALGPEFGVKKAA